MAAGYDEWSENYEEMMIWKGGYRGPAITLEEALRWVPPERRAKARVLDVAAGTGCVGRELHREGFRHIDAVDPSEGMMKQRETGIYTNDFLEFIGSGHSTVPKGGFVIIVMRHEYLQTVPSYKDKLEPYMDQLEADGKWKKSPPRGLRLPTCCPEDYPPTRTLEEAMQVKSRMISGGQHEPIIIAAL
ncbi:uncharacterized protein LOC127002645 isoform X2 [Eriocheir sinensis]|uniref:uncharacterized protein LOC127002645 isoform X2 n=1 Tax=Eriocheir sinensis TaxID=95602 RepID=UPI0021CA2DE1|nr:uncharacterized protein LOC127002645 isoform X2 [Eriocheir sinensis]